MLNDSHVCVFEREDKIKTAFTRRRQGIRDEKRDAEMSVSNQ